MFNKPGETRHFNHSKIYKIKILLNNLCKKNIAYSKNKSKYFNTNDILKFINSLLHTTESNI